MTILPQRPLRGSRISSFYPIKSLPSLASLDSAFQLQEYISLLIRLDVHDVESIVSLPGKRAGKEKEIDHESEKSEKSDTKDGEDSEDKGKNEVTVDQACWIYEQLRRLAQDLTHPLITMLQQECTRASCPEMKAGEWLYLCVAHGTDGNVEQCCAIDYILHTLDSATALLNTPRAFPSRLQIPASSHRHFSSLARRLGRIFAHAYFHHREAFEQAEAESSLYARFLALTSKFDLVPSEFLVIPMHSGSGSDSDSDREGDDRREFFDADVPRLHAAAVDPNTQEQGQWARRGSVVPIEPREKSSSLPGLIVAGSESPRKVGRNRTDTMVLHDAYAVAEELAKASPKVPPLDELLSPVDAEELPTTAKPTVESLEQIGSSLPESPTLHSPPPPRDIPSLPLDAEEEVGNEEANEDVLADEPAPTFDAEPATAEEISPAPVEADIADVALIEIVLPQPSTEAEEKVEEKVKEDEVKENEDKEDTEAADEESKEEVKELEIDVKHVTTEEEASNGVEAESKVEEAVPIDAISDHVGAVETPEAVVEAPEPIPAAVPEPIETEATSVSAPPHEPHEEPTSAPVQHESASTPALASEELVAATEEHAPAAVEAPVEGLETPAAVEATPSTPEEEKAETEPEFIEGESREEEEAVIAALAVDMAEEKAPEPAAPIS